MNTTSMNRPAFRLGLLLAAVPMASIAAEDEPGAWLIASTNDALSEQSAWRYSLDAQYRLVDDPRDFRQFVIRPAVGYTLANGMQVWAGYARVETRARRANDTFENRYWQQVNWRAAEWDSGTLNLRARLEERDLSTGKDLAVVLRFLVNYVRPFGNVRNRYFTTSIEPFVDFRDTDWGAEEGLSQIRLFAGVGQEIGEKAVLEAGYMNQYFRRDAASDRSNHLLTLHFRVRL